MEQLNVRLFKEAAFHSRNAEEALLVAMNACARVTEAVSEIEPPDPTAFGAWFRRIQGQRTGSESVLAAQCLSHLDLTAAILDIGDFYATDFSFSRLVRVRAHYACFGHARFQGTDLTGAILDWSNFQGASLRGATLCGARLRGTILDADLEGADLSQTDLRGSSLGGDQNITRTHFGRANLRGANLTGANLEGVDLARCNLEGAELGRALAEKAKLRTTKKANPQPANVARKSSK